MWVVNAIGFSSLDRSLYYAHVRGYDNDVFHVGLKDIAAGGEVFVNVSGYDSAVELIERYHPYGGLRIDEPPDGKHIIFIAIDDWSLRFHACIRSVEQVFIGLADPLARRLALSSELYDIVAKCCVLEDTNTLFMYKRVADGSLIPCTLFSIVSYEKRDWVGDCFYLFISRVYSGNRPFGVDVCKVEFSDVEKARALLGKFALVDKSIIEKLDWEY